MCLFIAGRRRWNKSNDREGEGNGGERQGWERHPIRFWNIYNDQKAITWDNTDHFSNLFSRPRIFSWLFLICSFRFSDSAVTTWWFIISGPLCWNWYNSANKHYFCAKQLFVVLIIPRTIWSKWLSLCDFYLVAITVCCKVILHSVVRPCWRYDGKYFLDSMWQSLRQLGRSFVKFCWVLGYY